MSAAMLCPFFEKSEYNYLQANTYIPLKLREKSIAQKQPSQHIRFCIPSEKQKPFLCASAAVFFYAILPIFSRCASRFSANKSVSFTNS